MASEGHKELSNNSSTKLQIVSKSSFPGSKVQHSAHDGDRQKGHVSSGERSRREVVETTAEAVTGYLGQGHHTVLHVTRFCHSDVLPPKGTKHNSVTTMNPKQPEFVTFCLLRHKSNRRGTKFQRF